MNYIAVWSSIMVHAARNTKRHETPTPGYFIFNLWLIVSLWLAFRQLQWVILQYDYDVNTTVLKLLYSTNSKAQHYKANGHLSIDLFVFLMKNIMKYTKNTLHWFKATHLYSFQIWWLTRGNGVCQNAYILHQRPTHLISNAICST